MPMHFRPRPDPAGHPFRRTFGRRGHPFRRSLSGRAGHPIRAPMKDTGAAVPLETRDEDGDLKLFVLSFTAFFICFATFLF